MNSMIKGQKAKILDVVGSEVFEVGVFIDASMTVDITCFGLDDKKQLSDDRYMIFYNQMSSPEKSLEMTENKQNRGTFKVNLSMLSSTIKNLVFTATIDGEDKMSDIVSGEFHISANGQKMVSYQFNNKDFKNERAVIISEIYFKDVWRVGVVGDGFDGGLSALLKHFGGVDADEQSVQQPVQQPMQQATAQSSDAEKQNSIPVGQTVNLEKRIKLEKKMEERAPQILSLAKKATVSLKKAGLENHTAKVALCLDISGSMSSLYKSGKIQNFAERILALGCKFDDDGSIDVFLFGAKAHEAGEFSIDNFNGYITSLTQRYPLEGGTYYGKAMKIIREFYFPNSINRKITKAKYPVYVMFVTDGATFDEDVTCANLQDSSYEGIFWQYMAIGKSSKDVKTKGIGGFFRSLAASDFRFLEELDNLQGRLIDNANFFSVEDPSNISDEELYDLLMKEYPTWLKQASEKGLI
ncbi:VWA domain-containing protein [Pseudobacteroides cellulosolvens]|uniref:von Willebrand factor type A n=1 Tax=Pseudobacteroides cellulosolvens ATCC 35603 = DSM 2933 TaxID=398512 RepID=A0A0L6JVN4_9FIRM|nr:VWA domain-containing protein [Pseudobacteroides cellulosolvens]KNY29926.1 von Willebrand factor type A [Pseudobacteroides cellulosolvens ATCC 35603 = DSM 2933]